VGGIGVVEVRGRMAHVFSKQLTGVVHMVVIWVICDKEENDCFIVFIMIYFDVLSDTLNYPVQQKEEFVYFNLCFESFFLKIRAFNVFERNINAQWKTYKPVIRGSR